MIFTTSNKSSLQIQNHFYKKKYNYKNITTRYKKNIMSKTLQQIDNFDFILRN